MGLPFHFLSALSRRALALGAPVVPGFLIRSPDPSLIRLRLAWILAQRPGVLAIVSLLLCFPKVVQYAGVVLSEYLGYPGQAPSLLAQADHYVQSGLHQLTSFIPVQNFVGVELV
jgi:hypothetical protein